MIRFLEQFIAAFFNRLRGQGREAWQERGSLDLGFRVVDGQVTRQRVTLSNQRRTMHLAVLGKTGTGKSSFLRYLAQQDIAANRGFLYFDLHGDATPFLLRTINTRERRERRHLSDRLVIVEPADPMVSVGLNPLEQQAMDFVRTAEFAQVLKERWHLDSFGARTDELLRNSLYVLAANGLTLVELAIFLTDAGFRAACLKRVDNTEIRQYFELRYDQASEPMRATMREPILNKTSAFTADPHFRHIVGQPSTFSMKEAMDEGHWVIVNLEKGRLGEQALTLGSLILTVLKNALFTREKRSLFTVYCDEIQNLIVFDSGLETLLSEARKFGASLVSANQFLDQYPPAMRSALAAVGSHIYFQLSSSDAEKVAGTLDGGRTLGQELKNLPQRHLILKSGHERFVRAAVPEISPPTDDAGDLLRRSLARWAKRRAEVEAQIQGRHQSMRVTTSEVLHDWE